MKYIPFLLMAISFLNCHNSPDTTEKRNSRKNPRQLFTDKVPEFGDRLVEEWISEDKNKEKGFPYIGSYKSDLRYGNQNLDVTIGRGNLVFMANRRGIQVFDGRNWKRIALPFLVYKVHQKGNRIYLGGDNNFGYIARSDSGKYHFNSLAVGNRNIGVIDRVSAGSKHVYFGGYKTVARYHIPSDSLVAYVDEEPVFNGLFVYSGLPYVHIKGEGLWEFPEALFKHSTDTFTRNVIEKLPFKETVQYRNDSLDFGEQEILFAFEMDTAGMLIGTGANVLYRLTGNGLELMDYDAAHFVRKSLITDGTRIGKRLFAISTRTGGAVVVDAHTGKTLRTINYQTGLPGDEIQALTVDHNAGLWLAHDYGLSRVDFRLPVRDFSQIPGLEGNNTGVVKFRDKLYVSTTQGLFYKDKVKNFKEISELVKVKKEEETEQEEDENLWQRLFDRKKEEKQQEKDEKEKPGLLKRFFNKLTGKDKKGDEDEEDEATDTATPKTAQQEQSEYVYKEKKRYALQSIKHIFKQVKNLDAKVLSAKVVDDELLIGTNKGLYTLEGNTAETILENTYIYQIALSHKKNSAWVAAEGGVYLVYQDQGTWDVRLHHATQKPVYSVAESNKHSCWYGTDDLAVELQINDDDEVDSLRKFPVKAPFSERIQVMRPAFGKIMIVADDVFIYDNQQDSLIKKEQKYEDKSLGYNLLNTQDSLIWEETNNKWRLMNNEALADSSQYMYLKIFNNIQDLYFDGDSNIWLITNIDGLYKIERKKDFVTDNRKFRIHINSIRNKSGKLLPCNGFDLDYQQNAISVNLGAPFYVRSDAVKFQYKLEGLSDGWSDWRHASVIEFPFIPYGDYLLKIRGMNMFGQISPVREVRFVIQTPFWLQWWFMVLVALMLVLIAGVVVHLRMRALRKENLVLEQKVRERTREIQKKQDEITQSITYGKRIQTAMLPPEEVIDRKDVEHFTFYKPRDIVSGDFYWYSQQGEKTFYAAVDCTGHGVPGAFLSMLGMAFLNEIVNERKIVKPAEILNELRSYIIRSLRQTGEVSEQQDGMDMAVVVIDHKEGTAAYAGAYNPLYMVRNKELSTIKASRMPIGIYRGKAAQFTDHEFPVAKGDTFYIFSDGFADQLGGPNGRKYMAGKLKRFLLSIHHESMKTQRQMLEEEFFNWKGEQEQIDDVLIMGIRIK